MSSLFDSIGHSALSSPVDGKSPSSLYHSIKQQMGGSQDIIKSMIVHNNSVMEKYTDLIRQETQQYFVNIIENLINEHNEKFNSREEELHHQIQQLQQTIVSLQIDVEQQQQRTVQVKEEEFKVVESLGESKYYDYYKYKSKFSVKNLFAHWKIYKIKEKTFKKQEKYVDRVTRHQTLTKYFSLLAFQYQSNKFQLQYMDVKFKYDQLSSEMVMQYEHQYQKLQSELHESYKLIKEEEKKRLLLEDEMRKMLLKNMTNINFETLHIFQQINQNNDNGNGNGGDISPLPPQLKAFAESLQAANTNTTTMMGGSSGKESGKLPARRGGNVNGHGYGNGNTLTMSVEEKLQTLATQPTPPPPPHPYNHNLTTSVTNTLPPPPTATSTSFLSPSSSLSSIPKGLTASMISNTSSLYPPGYTQGEAEGEDEEEQEEEQYNTAPPPPSSSTGILDRSQDPYFLDRLSHLYQQSMSTTNKLAHHEWLPSSNNYLYPPGAAGGIPVPNTSISYQLPHTPTSGSGMQPPQQQQYRGRLAGTPTTSTSTSKRMSMSNSTSSSTPPPTTTNTGRSITPGSARRPTSSTSSVTSSHNVVGITIASTAGYPTPTSRGGSSGIGNNGSGNTSVSGNTPPPRPMRF